MNLPNDADGDAMRRILNDGSDPAKSMEIDFMIDCPSMPAAEEIAPAAAKLGYAVKIVQDPGEDDGASITCYCTKNMMLDYDALIVAQAELHRAAEPFGGYIDGWGTFGNKPARN